MLRAGQRKTRRVTAMLLAVPLVISGVVALGASPASAATTTLSSPTTVSGSQTLSSTGVIASGAGVTATFDLVTVAQWSQPAAIGTGSSAAPILATDRSPVNGGNPPIPRIVGR